jgi:Carboxypeptidase regulatory-like domain
MLLSCGHGDLSLTRQGGLSMGSLEAQLPSENPVYCFFVNEMKLESAGLSSIRKIRRKVPFMKTTVMTCMLFLMSCATVWAQGGATAQMHGAVRDSTGAVVPGADVKATQTDTGVVRSTTTGADGGYVLTNLPLGPYRVEVSKQGFTTFVQTGIVLTVGSAPAVNMTLQVGAVTQQVVVESQAPLVETQSTSVGQLVDTQRVLDLPLNGRQVTDLITLAGAAVSNTAAQGVGRTLAGPPVISMAGGLAYSAGYAMDGANYFNYTNSSTYRMPFPDALQEFRVDTSGFTSQQASFAQVSAATKSGSNALHGDLFEFIRNSIFNAQNTLAPVKDNQKRNQFGGTIGGPIKKDKLFFFLGYQGTTIRSNNVINPAILPSQAMLQNGSDWSTYFSPACNGGQQLNPNFSGSATNPFVVNTTTSPYTVTLNSSVASVPALNLLKLLAASDPAPDKCGNLLYGTPLHINEHEFLGRLDYQSGKHTLFARYFGVLNNNEAPGFLTKDLLAATGSGDNSILHSAVLGWTFVASSSLVNSLRLSMEKIRYRVAGTNFEDGCTLGIVMNCSSYPGASVNWIIGNAFNAGVNLKNGAFVDNNSYYLNEDLSVIRGNHQFSFGGVWGLDEMNQTDCFFCSGVVVGSNSATGTYLSDLLDDHITVFTQSAHWHNSMRAWRVNLYAMDTWRATPRLTLTFGVRWEPWLPETLTSGNIASFDYSRFKALLPSTVHPDSSPGLIYPGDPNFPNGQKGMNNHWNYWAPRVGLAFDPTGSGKTSIRASWGLSYDIIGAHIHDDQTQQAPFYNLTQGVGGGLTCPWFVPYGLQAGFFNACLNPAGPTTKNVPFPALVGTIPPFTEQTAIPYDINLPYTMSYNLSVQRQLSSNWVVSLSYIGSQTRHMWNEQPLNYAIFCPGNPACAVLGIGGAGQPASSLANLNQRRILNLPSPYGPGLHAGAILLLNSSGTANYNGMLLSVEHRLSHNFSLQANWTWSHCISDFDPDPAMQGGEDDYMWTNPQNMRFDRGNCDEDVRNIFNLNGIARTPEFSGRSWGPVARGWQLAPIFVWRSGQPLNVIVPGDVSGFGSFDPIKGSFYERANCNPSVNPYGPSGPGGQYLNPAAFSFPAPGTLGNCPYNGFHAPAYWQFDASLTRQFHVHENQYIEIRADAFNLLNKPRPGYCDQVYAGCQFLISPYLGRMTFSSRFTQLGAASFGKIITTMDPRIMQLAIKYVF